MRVTVRAGELGWRARGRKPEESEVHCYVLNLMIVPVTNIKKTMGHVGEALS